MPYLRTPLGLLQWQTGRMTRGLTLTSGPCWRQPTPRAWVLGSQAQRQNGSRAPAHCRLLFQEAILISLAALQPGLTEAGAQRKVCQALEREAAVAKPEVLEVSPATNTAKTFSKNSHL